MRFYRHEISLLATGFLSTLLVGCAVGPDFHSPKAPKTQTYTKTPLPKKTVQTSAAGNAGRSQRFMSGEDIPAEWWALFHSKAINQLVSTGIANSPTLTAAEATLRQANETLNAQIGTLFYPAVTLPVSGQRQRFSDSTFGDTSHSNIFNLFNASVNVTYTLDVFGGSRRQIEALRAQVDYQRYQYIATYLTLTSNIVTTAMTVASLQSQIEAMQRLIEAEERQLGIIQQQFHLGGASSENVLLQQTLLEQARALLPPLKKSLAQSQHALAIMVGSLPSEASLPSLKLNQLNLPAQIPVSLPSALVRQRPDVQAQEALYHQACANVGVATANLFPQFTLSGSYGYATNVVNQLLSSQAAIWSWGGQITQPIFNGGALLAQRRAAIAAYEAAGAQYRQTVLKSFKEVADSLRAIEMDAKLYRAQKQAEIAAKKTLSLVSQQYRLGAVNYLNLLTAEEKYQQAVINRVQAQAARYTDTVALFQALGGGWWHRA